MLWAILYFYLFGSSAGGGLVKDISEPVKQNIKIEATAKQIIEINKKMLEEEADFNQTLLEARKQIAKINANRLASESEFIQVFAALDAQRAATREKILDNRFKMRELMSAEEWSRVYAAITPQE